MIPRGEVAKKKYEEFGFGFIDWVEFGFAGCACFFECAVGVVSKSGAGGFAGGAGAGDGGSV